MEHDIQFDEGRHEYTVDGVKVPSVTDIISPITASEYSKINPAVLEKAALKGSLVHEWCEMYDYGCAEDEVPAEIVPYCQAYAAFVRDYKPEWKIIEGIVYNEYLGYCGRLDRFGMVDGKQAVLDIKTIAQPGSKTHAAVCCQTEAYRMAVESNLKLPLVDANCMRYALYLKPDGTYRLFDCKEWELKKGFSGSKMFLTLLDVIYDIARLTAGKNVKSKGEN